MLSPRASFIIEERATGAVIRFVLTTTAGPRRTHIAQVAVDPAWGSRGISRSLVRMTAMAAVSAGLDRLTLLVAGENDAASHPYAVEGFGEIG